MKTKSLKAKEIKRDWHIFDAKGKVLGRLAAEIAPLLVGKNKVDYTPNLDCGDYIVVINASQIEVTGNKDSQKVYHHHSGYPGGLRATSYKEQMAKDPCKIISHAVAGMLPINKLRSKRLFRLKVFSGEEHPYTDKFKKG